MCFVFVISPQSTGCISQFCNCLQFFHPPCPIFSRSRHTFENIVNLRNTKPLASSGTELSDLGYKQQAYAAIFSLPFKSLPMTDIKPKRSRRYFIHADLCILFVDGRTYENHSRFRAYFGHRSIYLGADLKSGAYFWPNCLRSRSEDTGTFGFPAFPLSSNKHPFRCTDLTCLDFSPAQVPVRYFLPKYYESCTRIFRTEG